MPPHRSLSLSTLASLIFAAVLGVHGSPAKRLIEKYFHARDVDRVSWKECNLSDGERLDCGFYGVDEEACYGRGCCWGESKTTGVPWCYHSIPTIRSACLMNPDERLECGWYGIRKEQCLAKECCWQPTNEDGAPWCYNYRRVPVYEGECGVPANPPAVLTRIVGGEEAKAHSWPWMVSLQGDGNHFCGGSLVNEQWVVSAAHCEPGFSYASTREVVLGLHSQNDADVPEQRVRVVEVIPHDQYATTNNFDNDIMLLKLEHPVNFHANVSPICMPEEGYEIEDGRRCYTTGWGTLSSGGSAPDKLQQVMVPILSTERCNDPEWYDGKIDDSMVCAGYEEGGRDSCQGDSGGPLVCYGDDHWSLIGIVSWGEGCAFTRKPGIYAKVSRGIKWIEQNIAENSK